MCEYILVTLQLNNQVTYCATLYFYTTIQYWFSFVYMECLSDLMFYFYTTILDWFSFVYLECLSHLIFSFLVNNHFQFQPSCFMQEGLIMYMVCNGWFLALFLHHMPLSFWHLEQSLSFLHTTATICDWWSHVGHHVEMPQPKKPGTGVLEMF